jgi:hypothetical protein
MRAPDRLDSPVYEPDEEHATAPVLNAKERMDPRLENANRGRGCWKSVCCCCREFEMSELRRVEEKRRSDLTLNARLGRQDKANWRSLAPTVAKACLHIGFCTLRRRLNGTWRGGVAPLFELFCLISILQAMAHAMCVDERPVICSPCYALMRFETIDLSSSCVGSFRCQSCRYGEG